MPRSTAAARARRRRRQARAEVAYAASFVEFFAEEAKRIEGGVLPGPTPSKRILVLVKLVKMVKMVWVRTVRLVPANWSNRPWSKWSNLCRMLRGEAARGSPGRGEGRRKGH